MTPSLSFWRLVWRLLRRDWRAGELGLLAASLVVAVASLCSVAFFTDRVQRALELESHQLLGADLLLTADHPWPPRFAAEAARRGLTQARSATFPSMLMGQGDRPQLAEIKAVSPAYPLRGRLRLAPAPGAPDRETRAIPAPGQIWLEERLAREFPPGSRVQVGQSQLAVAGVLTQEPDRGVSLFSVAPRLLMNEGDLPATGLIQPGSRVQYRLLLAGPPGPIAAYRAWALPRLGRGEHLEDGGNARPEMRNALDRARQFLGLASLLAVILAAAGVALAARRYLQRHLDACAVMRCLGATQGRLLGLFLGQFLLLGLGGSLAGVALGWGAHWLLQWLLAGLLATPLPPPSPVPAFQGLAAGLVLLFGFALPPLIQLGRVDTLRVLRRELGAPAAGALASYGLGLAALAGLVFWAAGEPRLGTYASLGFLGLLAVDGALAWGLLYLLGRWRRHRGPGGLGHFGWRYALMGLERRAGATVAQVVALSLGLTALLLLTVTRGDLLASWHRALPADAPNRFVINIQPEQRQAVGAFLRAGGLPVTLAPMVRARLVAVNGRPVTPASYPEDQARRLVEREFNLSWRDTLPEGNRQGAGRWFRPGDKGVASLEEGLAKTLGLRVGDRLSFTVAGERLAVTVVGLRRLSWDSMRVNFFVLTPTGVLEDYPASWITSFYLPPARAGVEGALVQAFPNLTVIDVGAILAQLQDILDQVAAAVQFVFLFTLAAGLLVLYAALAVSRDERRYELALLRALGARRRQLSLAVFGEFALVGGLAGLIAAGGSQAVGWLLAREVFHLTYGASLWAFPLATLGGALVVATLGSWFARPLFQAPPMEALRAGE